MVGLGFGNWPITPPTVGFADTSPTGEGSMNDGLFGQHDLPIHPARDPQRVGVL